MDSFHASATDDPSRDNRKAQWAEVTVHQHISTACRAQLHAVEIIQLQAPTQYTSLIWQVYSPVGWAMGAQSVNQSIKVSQSSQSIKTVTQPENIIPAIRLCNDRIVKR